MSRRKRQITPASPQAPREAGGGPAKSSQGHAGTATSEQEATLLNEPGLPAGSKSNVITAAIVGLIALAVFVQAIPSQFLAVDDNEAVYANPHITDLLYFWFHPYFRLYTPVTSTIYVIVAALFRLPHPVLTPVGGSSDLSPHAFHAANVIFHAGSAVIAFFLLKLWLSIVSPTADEPVDRAQRIGAGLGALLFGLHPLQVEPAAWVNGANNVFSGFFALLGLYLYTLHGLAQKPTDTTGRRRGSRSTEQANYGYFIAATATFALALLAKPTAVALPLAAWLVDALIVRKPWRHSLLLIIWLGLSAWNIQATLGAQTGQLMVVQNTPLWIRPFLLCDSTAFYLWKLIAPVNLGFDYGRSPDYVRLHTAWYITWIVPCGLAALLWWRRKEWPVPLAAGALFIACLLPTAGLVTSYFQAVSTVADRYVYLAMIGPAFLLAWAASRYRVVIGPAVIVLAVLAVLTSIQIRYWRNTYTIMNHTVAVSPYAWFARENLSTWLDRRGHYQQAYGLLSAAVRIGGKDSKGHGNLGRVLHELGRDEDAIVELQKAIDSEPPVQVPGTDMMTVTEDCLNDTVLRATILDSLGRHAEALEEVQQALKYNPDFQPAKDELSVLQTPHLSASEIEASEKCDQARKLFSAGQHDQAIALLNQAIALSPNFARPHSDLAVAYSMLGRNEDAISELQTAATLDPTDVPDRLDLGKLLMAKKDRQGAIDAFQNALKIDPNNADAQTGLQQADAVQP